MCKVKIICPECGSDNICKDATAFWSIEAQAWQLSDALQDYETCQDCGWESDHGSATRQPLAAGEA